MFKFLKKVLPVNTVIVYQHDPHGLIQRDLTFLRKYAGTGKYTVGDSIESVAYRQGQLDLITVIETKIVSPRRQNKNRNLT